MDDPLVVGGGQAPGHLQGVVGRLADGKGSDLQTLPQRLAFEQLRDEVGRALVVPDVVDGEDVRVVEEAGGAGLVLEPVAAGRIGGYARRAGP